MKKKLLIFLSLILFCLSACEEPESRQSDRQTSGNEYAIKLGDNPGWSDKNLDVSKWDRYEDVKGKGVFWFRLGSVFSDKASLIKDPGIMIGAAGSYQAFWDGVFIGETGRLKTEGQSEIPGKYIQYYPLPDSLTKEGYHVLALRMTSDDMNIGLHAFFEVGEYQEMIREPLELSLYMFLLAGAFLISSIFFLFVFLNARKEYSILIFSLICLIFCAVLLMEYLKWYYTYPYPFQHTRLVIIGWLHIALSILVPLYFMVQFKFPWKKYLLLVMAVSIACVGLKFDGSYDFGALVQNILMWGFSTIVVAYSCQKRDKSAYIVMTGLMLSVAIIYIMPNFYIPWINVFDVSIFIGYAIMILSMLYVMSVKRKEERLAYEASLVLSERLKNELLKKNIKPHFIMNTLTSLIDWVEESPKEGVQFINALADEFEVLNQVADAKQISIEQEIKLCQSHIKVMGYRKEITYQWESVGIDPQDVIPPAIIHTAVENGVTHSLPDESGVITFRLTFERTKKYKQYTLQTIAKNRSANLAELPKDIEGTGLKYIKSRLKESYQDNWEIYSEANDLGWETRIRIY